MTSFMCNRVSIPPKRFRFGLSDDGECHSYLQARHLQARHLIQCLEEFSSTIGFLYLPKGLESGCQEYKKPSPYVSEFLVVYICTRRGTAIEYNLVSIPLKRFRIQVVR